MKPFSFYHRSWLTWLLLMIILLGSGSFIAGCVSSGAEGRNSWISESLASDQITIVDDLNRTVLLPHYPQRIVSVNHNILNLLIAYGAGDKVVGVPEYVLTDNKTMKFLPNAAGVAGSLANVNCEQIIGLKPDLIIAFANYKPRAGDRIDTAKIPIIYLNGYYITDILKDSQIVGQVSDNEEKAERYNRFVSHYLSLIENRTSNLPEKPRVYLEWSSDTITQGKNSQGDRCMKALHAINIAGDLSIDYPTISHEWVIKQNPDVIIKFVSGTGLRENTTSFAAEFEKLINRTGFSTISAVKNGRVYLVNQEIMSNSRGVAGILYLARALYPDSFADIDPKAVLHTYATEFQPDADAIQHFYPAMESGKAVHS